MSEMPSTRYVLLDRDGVVNVAVRDGYVASPNQVVLLAGAGGAIALLNRHGYRVLVVSNQQGVGKGIVSQAALDAISEVIRAGVEAAGGAIDGFFYCTHLVAEACACRKPKPGLILDAQRRHGFELAATFLVGDSYTDLVTAEAAGCRALLVLSGLDAERYRAGEPLPVAGVPVLPDLDAAAHYIIEHDTTPNG